MKTSRKHLLALTLLTALSPLAPTAAFAQLHLEIAKAPDQAPKIAIVPFNNDNGLYPIVETDLTLRTFHKFIKKFTCECRY